MDEQQLEQAMAQLGIDRFNHRVIALLPLVQVAWADGRIQGAERRLILDTAAGHGLTEDTGLAILERWLSRRPTEGDFLLARRVLLALVHRRDPAAPEPDTLPQLVRLCHAVAEAAGGFFGVLFTVSASEREMIQEIAASLRLGPALPQPAAARWAPAQSDGGDLLAPDDPTDLHPVRPSEKRRLARARRDAARVSRYVRPVAGSQAGIETELRPRPLADGTQTERIGDGISGRAPMRLDEDDEVTEQIQLAPLVESYRLEDD